MISYEIINCWSIDYIKFVGSLLFIIFILISLSVAGYPFYLFSVFIRYYSWLFSLFLFYLVYNFILFYYYFCHGVLVYCSFTLFLRYFLTIISTFHVDVRVSRFLFFRYPIFLHVSYIHLCFSPFICLFLDVRELS